MTEEEMKMFETPEVILSGELPSYEESPGMKAARESLTRIKQTRKPERRTRRQVSKNVHPTAPLFSRLVELQSMPYQDYLKSPEWARLKRIVFKWAGGRCQVCNDSRGPFNVHHRDYSRRGCELLSDVLLLCERCHTMFHEQRHVEGA